MIEQTPNPISDEAGPGQEADSSGRVFLGDELSLDCDYPPTTTITELTTTTPESTTTTTTTTELPEIPMIPEVPTPPTPHQT
jgi:hypothetical protein